jgi:hypothetical protein
MSTSAFRRIASLVLTAVTGSVLAVPAPAAAPPATPTKTYAFRSHPDAPNARGYGGCLATDRIAVDGVRVNYMRREKPAHPQDSGWRFFAGDESPEYMAVNAHHDVYSVNTIVNHDPDVFPFLDAPVGSEFERDGRGQFQQVK